MLLGSAYLIASALSFQTLQSHNGFVRGITVGAALMRAKILEYIMEAMKPHLIQLMIFAHPFNYVHLEGTNKLAVLF